MRCWMSGSRLYWSICRGLQPKKIRNPYSSVWLKSDFDCYLILLICIFFITFMDYLNACSYNHHWQKQWWGNISPRETQGWRLKVTEEENTESLVGCARLSRLAQCSISNVMGTSTPYLFIEISAIRQAICVLGIPFSVRHFVLIKCPAEIEW